LFELRCRKHKRKKCVWFGMVDK